jgi:hypothetical protein
MDGREAPSLECKDGRLEGVGTEEVLVDDGVEWRSGLEVLGLGQEVRVIQRPTIMPSRVNR